MWKDTEVYRFKPPNFLPIVILAPLIDEEELRERGEHGVETSYPGRTWHPTGGGVCAGRGRRELWHGLLVARAIVISLVFWEEEPGVSLVWGARLAPLVQAELCLPKIHTWKP